MTSEAMYFYRAITAEIQHLAGDGNAPGIADSPLPESSSDTKRVEDESLQLTNTADDLGNDENCSEDIPESERDTIVVKSVDDGDFKLRAYQDEMLDESLKRNTIVVLNTGAGKTHIALARTRAELESDQSDKIVWFLAPTVALCHQHYKSINVNLPAYQTRLLTSEDGVDRWTEQTIWDGILQNMRIVISTYGVLYDALCHGFVKMKRLSLCVFDEAHHCTKKHASNMIMQQFYRPAKLEGQYVPKILGLSASPVMNAKAGGLETLEANMDSHAITPRLHRSELMQYVHVPELLKRSYTSTESFDISLGDSLLGCLTRTIHRYDIRSDPYVTELVRTGGPDMQTKLNDVLMSRKTYCTDQLKALRNRAEVIACDVSLSASEVYIQACRTKFLAGARQNTTSWMPELTDKEKDHLVHTLSNLQTTSAISDNTPSPKTQLLLDILREEAGPSFTGIVFVEQRAVVSALAEYLTSIPEMSSLFNIGTFVGASNSSKKKTNIGDINDLKAQQQTLDDFRVGKKNLIIATSVLEEGIDVSSCQTVICFDAPLNLVSFVQRRGRARKKDSKYIILLADGDDKGEPAKWHQLEDRMKAAYEDEYRNAQLAAQLEQTVETDGRQYHVGTTDALLTLDNAKSHLYHFCATLQTNGSADHRPTFLCRTDAEELITAEVLLPACVNKRYRRAVSAHNWRTERAAVKDAAFEACVALHRGGLLNDHLLPPHIQTPDQARQNRPSLIEVAKRIDPWSLGQSNHWVEHFVDVQIKERLKTSMKMFLPMQCPPIGDIILHRSSTVKSVATIRPGLPVSLDTEVLAAKQCDTKTLLSSVFSPESLTGATRHCAVLFEADDHLAIPLTGKSLPANEMLSKGTRLPDMGLVRLKGELGRAYVLEMLPVPRNSQQLTVVKFPKKRDFLSIPAHESKKNSLTSLELPTEHCTIDVLPARYSFFAAFIPSILHKIENAIIASRLQTTVLKPIGIKNLQLIVEATTSGAADFSASYERLEYLGDAVLKYCTHVQLAAQHPDWPESYLTAEKGRTNGNASLSRAALKSGIDRFISTQKFTGNHWKPPYLNTAQTEDRTVQRSTKTLADVVEALIGAAFVDQGLEGALSCIKIFLPDEKWFGLPICHKKLLQQTPQSDNRSISHDILQKLIGHEFKNPALLLEATTHSSYTGHETLSYERLEFLGDAVLDQLLVPEIFAHRPNLKNHEMHRMRQSLANAHILGFCCLELHVTQERLEPAIDETSSPALEKIMHAYRLHDFLRCAPSIFLQRQDTLERFEALRPRIHCALANGIEYPWPDLFALRLPKWVSDIVEAVLGAIYIDTNGDLNSCRAFVERCGIFALLERFLEDGVAVGFPKERLGLLADKETVAYLTREEEVLVQGQKGRMWVSVARVGDRDVVEVRDCGSKEEAEVRAAAEAVRLLQFETIDRMSAQAEDGD